MDRNTFTGLFLIMIIIGASVFLMKPSEAELKKEQQVQDSIKKVGNTQAKATPSVIADTPKTIDSAALKGPFGASINGTEQTTVLENSDLKITFSKIGRAHV